MGKTRRYGYRQCCVWLGPGENPQRYTCSVRADKNKRRGLAAQAHSGVCRCADCPLQRLRRGCRSYLPRLQEIPHGYENYRGGGGKSPVAATAPPPYLSNWSSSCLHAKLKQNLAGVIHGK